MVLDRVPITAVVRSDEPFQHIIMDVVGPIEPTSSAGHKYCLCIIDSCTRWPAVFPLKSLSAKEVCEALVEFFMTVGVASIISSDQGTNFTSGLTREFSRLMGSSPRFNTPGHPEASGVCERWNQTFKRMIHHAIMENPRRWHKIIPFTVWAIREVPNATTGVAPFMMVYGRVPRGPLAILKESWTGDISVNSKWGIQPRKYLEELEANLKQAAQFAIEHSREKQVQYVNQYNKKARHKEFKPGDQIIVLYPMSTNKLMSRWQGPCKVLQRRSKYSYLVDMRDGGHRIIHANKMRKYVVRTMNCGLIVDEDVDFGKVVEVVVTSHHGDDTEIKLNENQIAHLDVNQQRQLLELLNRYTDRFSEQPGLCQLVEHEVQLQPGFRPKEFKAYRIPLVYREEVERQIQRMIKEKIIQPSTSPMASPLVIVRKKDGSLRLACDYRYINSYTVDCKYPMPMVRDVLNKISKAQVISIFDCRSAYWTCPVKASDRWKTAFVTHNACYEFLRVPFGMVNSGRTFVRAINLVLQPLQEFTEPYIDDIAVHSSDWIGHLKHIEMFLSQMRVHNVTLNLNKCIFGQGKVKFIGHLVGSGTCQMDPERIATLIKLQVPETKKQVKQLLGFFGYYRQYVANFAAIAKPLTDLTSKNLPERVVWTTMEQKAFDALKAAIQKDVVLSSFKIGCCFSLYCDSSEGAVGAVLTQMDDFGVDKPVAFISQKLSSTQKQWATVEKEAYAVVWALNKLREIIIGSKICIYTDHNPLTYLKESSAKSAKLVRWSLALQEFDFELRYKKGKLNVVADALSRLE